MHVLNQQKGTKQGKQFNGRWRRPVDSEMTIIKGIGDAESGNQKRVETRNGESEVVMAPEVFERLLKSKNGVNNLNFGGNCRKHGKGTGT